jgi:hypothetical protein
MQLSYPEQQAINNFLAAHWVDIGFPSSITVKAPSLAARKGFEYFKEWIYLKGVRSIFVRSQHRKHYVYFSI